MIKVVKIKDDVFKASVEYSSLHSFYTVSYGKDEVEALTRLLNDLEIVKESINEFQEEITITLQDYQQNQTD